MTYGLTLLSPIPAFDTKQTLSITSLCFSLISTTKKVLDKTEIESVIIPTMNGEIQVLPKPSPLFSESPARNFENYSTSVEK